MHLCSVIVLVISGMSLNGSGLTLPALTVIDGASDSHAISKIFIDKYRKLYMKRIQDEINSNICQVDCPDDMFVSALDIRAVVGRLKSGPVLRGGGLNGL